MEKDFDKWNKLKKNIDQSRPSIEIKEGEIRWCRFGLNIGHEIIGKGENFIRPVLILKKFSGDVFLGLPLTTKVHIGDWYYKIAHSDMDRFVILNQGRILDRKRLEEKLFEVSELENENVKVAYCSLIMKSPQSSYKS